MFTTTYLTDTQRKPPTHRIYSLICYCPARPHPPRYPHSVSRRTRVSQQGVGQQGSVDRRRFFERHTRIRSCPSTTNRAESSQNRERKHSVLNPISNEPSSSPGHCSASLSSILSPSPSPTRHDTTRHGPWPLLLSGQTTLSTHHLQYKHHPAAAPRITPAEPGAPTVGVLSSQPHNRLLDS